MKLCIAAVVALSAPLAAQTTTLAGVASDGSLADGEVRVPALSAAGEFVTFDAKAANLAVGDVNGTHDVFRHVRATGSTDLVSVSLAGEPGNGQSTDPCISANGRFVAFDSSASDLVSGDTNGRRDVFVRDLWHGITTRVSVSSAGAQGDGDSRGATIDGSGRFVAFSSTSANLVPGDTNGAEDVFVHDRRTGQTWRASVSTQGAQGSGASIEPALSGDGTHVAFTSWAGELVAGDTNGLADVFVRDMTSGVVVRASVPSGGGQAVGGSRIPTLSADGTVVAFLSSAPNLVPGDTNGYPDVFVHDLASGLTVRASVASNGNEADHGGESPHVSADGTLVAFMSYATNLGLSPMPYDRIYLRDLAAGTTEEVSLSTAGEEPDHLSNRPALGAEGRFVAFMSFASNLIPNPTPGYWKVFVRDREGCDPTIATYCTSSATSLGCFAGISAIGTPSLSDPQAFDLSSGTVPGGTLGVACIGVAGPDATPIGTQGGLLCIASFQRTAPLLAGGTPGICNGELRLSLADLVATVPSIAEPSGMTWVQFWFRDPGGADGFGLSNALWFQTCP